MSLQLLSERLKSIEVVETRRSGALTVHYLSESPPTRERGLVYRTLAAAIAGGAVEVEERSEGARVGSLSVRNLSGERIFILGG